MVADLGSALDTFTDLVDDGELTFCDEVLAELKKRALGDAVYTWAKAVAPNRCHFGADWARQRLVPEQFPSIVDPDDELCSAPAAVAHGLALHGNGGAVRVVTAEWTEKVTRSCVRSACQHFGLVVVRIEDLGAELGLV